MTYQSTIQAFYGADNGEPDVEVLIRNHTIVLCQGTDVVRLDRVAARTLANTILRELDKQS